MSYSLSLGDPPVHSIPSRGPRRLIRHGSGDLRLLGNSDERGPGPREHGPMVWDGGGGNRLGWAELPGTLRKSIEVAVGSPVVEAVDQAGGFSPACAARLRLADGRRVFAKAMTAAQHPDSLAFSRREIGVAGRLPAQAAAPRLLWSDDGDDGVVLVF